MALVALRPPKAKPEPTPPALPATLAIGGVLGLVARQTGTGGGTLPSPLMLLFNWADTKPTAATASRFILLNSLAGRDGLASAGWTPTPSLAVLTAAACLGGLIGATLGSAGPRPAP